MPDFLLPFGPLHIVLLHVPIGVLVAIWFIEIFLRGQDSKSKKQAVGLLFLLLIASTAITIILGLAYEDFGQYGEEVEDHELWGYIFGASVIVTYICLWVDRKMHKFETLFLYLFFLVFTTVAMVVTGHYGGEMVHGKGFITKPFKDEARPALPATPPAPAAPAPTIISQDTAPVPNKPAVAKPNKQAAVVEEKIVEDTSSVDMDSMMEPSMDMMMDPVHTMDVAVVKKDDAADPRIALFNAAHMVLERNCFECHGATKQKGRYRLDEKGTIYAGGKSRKVAITPGDPNHSELLYRMLLPVNNDDVMPPDNKTRVSPENIAKVREWIAAGAYWPSQEEIDNAPTEYVEIGNANTNEVIAKINETGAKAEYNAWGDESVRVDLGVVDKAEFEQALKAIKPLGNNLKWLDCSNLELPNNFFEQLKHFKQLQRLHLDGTNVNDANLKQLLSLSELNYLNLYNTNITDQGIASLKQHPGLEKIFLTDTKVTPKGVESLQESNEELEVIKQ